jgi:hypothetical protein
MHSTRAVLVLLLAAAPLAAQGGGRGNQRPGGPPPRAAILRGQIEETFKRRAMKELARPMTRLHAYTVSKDGRAAPAVEEEMRRLQDALDGELRPSQHAGSRGCRPHGQNRGMCGTFRDEMRDLQPVPPRFSGASTCSCGIVSCSGSASCRTAAPRRLGRPRRSDLKQKPLDSRRGPPRRGGAECSEQVG